MRCLQSAPEGLWAPEGAAGGQRSGEAAARPRRGAERRLPAGAATAHLLPGAGAAYGRGAEPSMRSWATGGCRRCAVERAQSARALSPRSTTHAAAPTRPASPAQAPPSAANPAFPAPRPKAKTCRATNARTPVRLATLGTQLPPSVAPGGSYPARNMLLVTAAEGISRQLRIPPTPAFPPLAAIGASRGPRRGSPGSGRLVCP